MGRSIDPQGRLIELNKFAAGSAVTPDGQFIWTVGGAGGPTRITRLSDGTVVQDIPSDSTDGGIAFSPDGRRAYVSSAGDHVRVYDVDPAAGPAAKAADIAVPPDRNAVPPIMPPDNLPPETPDHIQSYPEGLAVSPDGKTLVAALNLSDRVAIVDTVTRTVKQVAIRQDTKPGDRAMPYGVAIAGRTAFVADEGDGSLATVDLDSGSANRFYPNRNDDRINKEKTHPQAVVASHDGKHVYVTLTSSDRVLELDPANPTTPVREFDVGRGEGLGTQPVALALSGDDRYLFVGNSGEDVVRAIDLQNGRELARIPSGIYPNGVAVDEARNELEIVSLKGLGPGPTAGTNENAPNRIIGVLQSLPLPQDQKDRRHAIARYGKGGDAVPIPVDRRLRAPAGSPLVGADGRGPSPHIKYVFYVVTENKTYDNILGDLDRGDGDPCLALYGEYRKLPTQRDGSPCPGEPSFDSWTQRSQEEGRGDSRINDGTPITPNEHRIARQFVTIDHLDSDSETSDDGHLWTAGGYVNDYNQRNTRAPARPFDVTIPVSAPPKGFMFHALARQGVSFFNYGEAVGVGTLPDSRDTLDELAPEGKVLANSEFVALYPSSGAIDKDPITMRTTYDRDPDTQPDPTKGVSRMHYFRQRFQAQLAACPDPSAAATCAVPQYNHVLFPNNHTSGTNPGGRSPDALVRDTDQAIGQLVSDISHSKIWPYTAIFVVQDDAQDGADHVDGHRITTLVASPWAKRGAVVSDHYDDLSVKRTIEIALGMQPTYLYDALAAPMWDVFTDKPDNTPYDTYDIPEPLMEEQNTSRSALATTSSKQYWHVADAVDEGLLAKIQWADRTGSAKGCPRKVGPVGDRWSPCAIGDAGDRAISRNRGKAFLAQLREFVALQKANPTLTGAALAEKLHAI